MVGTISADTEMTHSLIISTSSPDETRGLGEIIGENARAGDVFLLSGPLGAGKTCLTQGIAKGLGVERYVRSPTFVLMTRHIGRLTLHHIDLYRISGPEEAWDLGLVEQTSGDGGSCDSICVVEWAERAGRDSGVFPPDSLWFHFSYGESDDKRVIEIDAGPTRYQRVVMAVSERLKSNANK